MSRLSLLLAVIAVLPAPAVAQAVDQYGDPLPPGALARLGTVRFRLPGQCTGVEFSRDGKTLVTIGGAGLLFWDVGTGKITHRLPNEEDRYLTFATLSPDHRLAAAVQYAAEGRVTTVRLFDVATGKPLRDIGAIDYGGMQFSPDGTRLAAYNSNSQDSKRADDIAIIDVATGGVVSSWKAEQGGVLHASFTKDGESLVTGGVDKSIRFWNVENGKELRRLTGNPLPVGHVTLSADEKRLAVLYLQDAEFARMPRHLPWFGENRIQVWDLEAGKSLYEFVIERPKDPYVKGVTSLAFTLDGKRLISGGIDRKTRVWDLQKGVEAQRFDISSDWHAALSANGRIFAASDQTRIRLLDIETGKELLSQYDPDIAVLRALTMADGLTVVTAGRREGLLDLWDAKTGRRTGQVGGAGDAIAYDLVRSEDSKWLITAAYKEGRIYVWDLVKNAAPREVPGAASRFASPGRFGSISALALAGDGKTLAVGRSSNPDVLLLDAETGNVLRELHGHPGGARHLFFAKRGQRLVVCGFDHTTYIWDLSSAERPRQIGPLGEPGFGGQPSYAHYVAALTGDGSVLVYVQEDGTASLFDLESGRRTYRIDASTRQEPSAVVLSPDARQFAYSRYAQPAIQLFETHTGKERHQFPGHEGGVYTLSFSADGKRLVSAGRDSTGLVWDVLGTQASDRSDAKLTQAWNDLAGEDAARAWEAIKRLAAAREPAVALLAKELKVIPPIDAAKLTQLVAALDSDSFAEREKASAELAKLGELAAPALDKLLKGNPSLEAKRRAETLVAKLGGPVTSPEQLRALRAIETLEYIGTPEALAVIEKLAAGAAGARATEDAKRAVERLKKRQRK